MSAAKCERSLKVFSTRDGQTIGGARCARSARFRVWWLMAENLALVQLPAAFGGSGTDGPENRPSSGVRGTN